MKQPIAGYHTDEENHWVAELKCGHFQHVRHDPPLSTRLWTQTVEGRDSMLGFELNCVKCDEGAPLDHADPACLETAPAAGGISKSNRDSDCDLATSTTDWLIEHPQLLVFFRELGIEYCCGGKSLEWACQERGLDPQTVLAQLEKKL